MLDASGLRGLAGRGAVVDRDGRAVGHVDRVFDDGRTGEPGWIGVVTGTVRRRLRLVPASGVEEVDGALRVPWTRRRVRHAPLYGQGDHRGLLGLGDYRSVISEAKEREAVAYYGLTEPRRPR
jgi:hypothetical protein